MTASQEPSYPPAHNAWSYPPPPVSSGWRWVAIAAGLLGSVAVVGLGITAFVLGERDAPGFIEDERVVSVIERECALMTSTIESMPLRGRIPQQIGTLIDHNRAIEIMLTDIRKVGADIRRDDQPTDDWLGDWDRLLAARVAYVDQLLNGDASDFEIPEGADGEDIDQRMDRVWLDEPGACRVPEALLAPYPNDRANV